MITNKIRNLTNEIHLTLTEWVLTYSQPSVLIDLLGGSTYMDVDVDILESEVNTYTRVQQVSIDTDPLMWWKQYVHESPLLVHMVRQYLVVSTTSSLRLLRDSSVVWVS